MPVTSRITSSRLDLTRQPVWLFRETISKLWKAVEGLEAGRFGKAVQAAGPVRRWLPGVGMTHPLDRFKSGPGDIV